MVPTESEYTVARGQRTDAKPRPARPHLVAGFWILAMLLALLGAVAVAALWIFGAPPQPCRLPLAPVPESPGQIAWSSDGTQLMAACPNGMYLVEFPTQAVRRVPMPGALTWMTWFDFQGRPLALVTPIPGATGSLSPITANGANTPRQSSRLDFQRTYQLLRWDDAAQRWRPLPVAGNQVSISPCGRYAAALHARLGPAKKNSAGVYVPPPPPTGRITVTDLQSGRTLGSFRFPRPGVPSLQWQDSRTLYLFQGMPVTADMTYRLGDAAPKPGPRAGLKPPTGKVAWVGEFHSGVSEVLERLRDWNVPGAPADDPIDLTLSVGRFGQTADREFTLGRLRSRTPYGTYRPAPEISPNGRYVAAVAGDGTLRLLDLKPSAPSKP